MYIPRPAKLLFQHDDGWERFLENNGHQLSNWTKLSVERMLACGTCAMGVRRYCCCSPDCTHSRFLCQSCKSKACSSCGLKGTEQWIAEQQHIMPDCDWQHITFTMPHLLWPFFNNNWPLLNELFRCATRAMLRQTLSKPLTDFCQEKHQETDVTQADSRTESQKQKSPDVA